MSVFYFYKILFFLARSCDRNAATRGNDRCRARVQSRVGIACAAGAEETRGEGRHRHGEKTACKSNEIQKTRRKQKKKKNDEGTAPERNIWRAPPVSTAPRARRRKKKTGVPRAHAHAPPQVVCARVTHKCSYTFVQYNNDDVGNERERNRPELTRRPRTYSSPRDIGREVVRECTRRKYRS